MSLLNNMRDKAIEALVRKNEFIQRFGEIENISIQSEKSLADISILLHGEPYPTTFQIHYSFKDIGKDTEVIISKISCKKKWINEVLAYWLEKNTLSYTLHGFTGGIAKFFF